MKFPLQWKGLHGAIGERVQFSKKPNRGTHESSKGRKVFVWALFLIGVTLWLGAVRRPYGEIISTETRGPSSATVISGDRFRVATFNMHGGGKEIGKEDLALTAQTLRGFDLVGLNEVRGPSLLRWRNQAEYLGEKLGAAAVFGPSERRWFVGSFGNGLLSRFPILTWQSQPMQVDGKTSYRALITARIAIADAIVTVIVVHVERGAMRDSQLMEVYERFSRVEAPALLLGDFNSNAIHLELRRIATLPGVTRALKAETDVGGGIDHIFVKGVRVAGAGYIPNQASDHPLAWTELEYPARSHRPSLR